MLEPVISCGHGSEKNPAVWEVDGLRVVVSDISLLVNSCLAIFNIWKCAKPVSIPVL